jgi:hypothetical protein
MGDWFEPPIFWHHRTRAGIWWERLAYGKHRDWAVRIMHQKASPARVFPDYFQSAKHTPEIRPVASKQRKGVCSPDFDLWGCRHEESRGTFSGLPEHISADW